MCTSLRHALGPSLYHARPLKVTAAYHRVLLQHMCFHRCWDHPRTHGDPCMLGSAVIQPVQQKKRVARSPQSMKYETLETRKDGTKFLSRDMKRAATRLQQLATAYDSKQQKLVEEVCPRPP